MPTYPTPQEFIPTLDHYPQVLCTIVQAAHGQLTKDMEGRAPYRFQRTKSTLMFEAMIAAASSWFADDPHVVEKTRYGTTQWTIRDHVVVRFKKLDKKRRPMNIPTQRSLDLLCQPAAYRQTDLPITVDQQWNVVVGYVLDPLSIAVEDILLVLTESKENVWEYSLLAELADIDTPVELSATDDGLPSALPATEPRVRTEDNADSGKAKQPNG